LIILGCNHSLVWCFYHISSTTTTTTTILWFYLTQALHGYTNQSAWVTFQFSPEVSHEQCHWLKDETNNSVGGLLAPKVLGKLHVHTYHLCAHILVVARRKKERACINKFLYCVKNNLEDTACRTNQRISLGILLNDEQI